MSDNSTSVHLCRKCGLVKPVDQFYADKRRIGGVLTPCKKCRTKSQEVQETRDPSVMYKDIPGFEGYCVGDDGSVWTCRKTGYGYGRFGIWKKLKSQPIPSNGRLQVSVAKDRGIKRMQVHQLVALAFIGPRPGALLVLHHDGNHLNNRPGNLRYGTYKDNEEDKDRHGRRPRGDSLPGAKLNEESAGRAKRMIAAGHSLRTVADHLGVSKKTIVNIKKGRIWVWVK